MLSKYEKQFSLHFSAESPDVWENIRKIAGEQRKKQETQNPPIKKKKHGAWCKKNGRKKEKQTKGIKNSIHFVKGRYRLVKFTSFHRVTISVYKLYR